MLVAVVSIHICQPELLLLKLYGVVPGQKGSVSNFVCLFQVYERGF